MVVLTKREQRVIKAFINCVQTGQFTFDYACLLIEDTDRYGYLSDTAKETFYSAFETTEKTQIEDVEAPIEEYDVLAENMKSEE